MMLKPSIDTLLDKVPSKYSLVILEAKRAHELEEGAPQPKSLSLSNQHFVLWKKSNLAMLGFTQILKASEKLFVVALKKSDFAKKKKSVKSKNKLPRKKKRVKNLRLGQLNLIFSFNEKCEVVRKCRLQKVIVDVPLMQTDKPYSYAVPKEFSTMLEIGMRVHVPFGKVSIV